MPTLLALRCIAAALLLGTVVVVPSVAVAWPVASSLRCGSRLVGPGLTLDDVDAQCGAPTARFTTTELVTVHVGRDLAITRPVVFDVWTYDRGPRRFVRFLTFRNGVLVDVDEGSYGR